MPSQSLEFTYSPENGDLSRTFEKQIIPFKRT